VLGRKGQALIEFVLILPILIMLIFAVIDFGNIFVNKNELESALGLINNSNVEYSNYDYIYNLVNKNRTKKIDVSLEIMEDNYIKIVLTRKIDIITPGLNLIIDDPYVVSTFRVVKYEQ